MFFYFIIITSVLLPLLVLNKKRALFVSFSLLFILLGFQYEMVQDWGPNIGRWNYANEGASIWEAGTGGRDIEAFFLYLLVFFKPITFYGWLALVALIFLSLTYYLIKEYVDPKFYWLSVFIFTFRTNYALLFINSNRQCVSLIFCLLAVLFLIEKFHIPSSLRTARFKYLNLAIALLLFIAAVLCHSAAYAFLPIILFYYICKLYNGKKWLILAIICNVLFWGKTLINLSVFQQYLTMVSEYLAIEHVDGYIESLEDVNSSSSVNENLCFSIIITVVCYSYRYLTNIQKFFAWSWFYGLVLSSYLVANAARMGEYGYYFLILVLPIVINVMKQNKKSNKLIDVCVTFVLVCFIYYNWTNMHHYLYERWLDYRSVFEIF